MNKYSNIKKLSKKEQNELFISFAKVLSNIKNSVEAANFIRDLFSKSEALMLARRLQIARLSQEGLTYVQIRKAMKVSQTTIAKVQMWLNSYGDGLRTIFKRSKNKTKTSDSILSWQHLKKKYPMYFWPELLLNEIIKNASKKEKERLIKIISKMKEKTKLTKQLLILLR